MGTILDSMFEKTDELLDNIKAGRGKGNWGHKGRKGQVGGSVSRGKTGSSTSSSSENRGKTQPADFTGTRVETATNLASNLTGATQDKSVTGKAQSRIIVKNKDYGQVYSELEGLGFYQTTPGLDLNKTVKTWSHKSSNVSRTLRTSEAPMGRKGEISINVY